ncbi:ATP-binding protein [Candidatus Microgenomates bacterium]|nr:ATP-binding protein [Candidatus Microgenomates bacterium]
MTYNIIIGRNQPDRELFGDKGIVYLGKLYVTMGQHTSLSNPVYMDVTRPHVVMIAGKRGSGKSYSGSVIAEEISRLPSEIKDKMTVLFFDTMGIFWTMRYPNTRQEELLRQWNLEPEGMKINVFTPKGFFDEYRKKGVPADYRFALKTSELDAGDWCEVFGVALTEPIGIFVERLISQAHEEMGEYSIRDLLTLIKTDAKAEKSVRDAAENRFFAAEQWGLFDKEGTTIEQLMKPGSVNVLDISAYTNVAGNWSIKGLVIGLICRKLLQERITARKEEELEDIKRQKSYFYEEKGIEKPMVWIMIDEVHEFLSKEGKTPATDALVQLLREGRQPGISLVLVTQQPGEIHKDVLTQSDIVLSHRLTAKADIEALNSMMQSYLVTDLQTYLNSLPKVKGASIILDDNSERIYPVGIHPKRSWHGGEAPSAIPLKKEFAFEVKG